MSFHRCTPATEPSGPQLLLQLLLALLAGLHVEVLEDVVFALGADLGWGRLQWVVVQRDALQVAQAAVAQGYTRNAIAGRIQADEGQLGYFCGTSSSGRSFWRLARDLGSPEDAYLPAKT